MLGMRCRPSASAASWNSVFVETRRQRATMLASIAAATDEKQLENTPADLDLHLRATERLRCAIERCRCAIERLRYLWDARERCSGRADRLAGRQLFVANDLWGVRGERGAH